VRVGRVARAHGLKGEVSVVETTDLPFVSLVGTSVWFVPPGAGLRSARIASVRQGPKGPLVTFDGITDADSAALLRGKDVTVGVEDLPEDFDDLSFDPIGMRVLDEERGDLGEIVDVIVTGANDVWVVEGGAYGQVLVPVIDDCVRDIDEEAGRVTVTLLPGLIEDE
jgi:16S rRNA processing protein RimM